MKNFFSTLLSLKPRITELGLENRKRFSPPSTYESSSWHLKSLVYTLPKHTCNVYTITFRFCQEYSLLVSEYDNGLRSGVQWLVLSILRPRDQKLVLLMSYESCETVRERKCGLIGHNLNPVGPSLLMPPSSSLLWGRWASWGWSVQGKQRILTSISTTHKE